jgi:hypothetical protein
MNADVSIARYEEKRFDGKRLFDLRHDHLAIAGSTSLGPRFESKVPLNALISEPDKMWTRPRGFWQGIVLLVGCVTVSMGFEPVLSSWWEGLFVCLAAAGALLSLATWRRVEWVVFRNLAGTPTVNIARSAGKDEKFDQFVQALRVAIDACKNACASN